MDIDLQSKGFADFRDVGGGGCWIYTFLYKLNIYYTDHENKPNAIVFFYLPRGGEFTLLK
jgi:hypothetical protein